MADMDVIFVPGDASPRCARAKPSQIVDVAKARCSAGVEQVQRIPAHTPELLSGAHVVGDLSGWGGHPCIFYGQF